MLTPLYSEKKLAEIFGLTRDDLRHARKTALKKERDFTEIPAGIVLTASGIGRLIEYWRATGLRTTITLEQLAACLVHHSDIADPEEPTTANGSAPPWDTMVALRVVRTFSNPRCLEARFPDGRRVQVTVGSNLNFVPNMGLNARPKAPGSPVYELVGRCPKRKGRALK